MFIVDSGILKSLSDKPVNLVLSPNFNERPVQSDPQISLLVIHNISLPPNSFGGGYVVDFFLNQLDVSLHPYFKTISDLKVSSHVFIDRAGLVTQFVPLHLRAWHAGISSYNGYEGCNDISIGIELEGADDIPYTQDQYDALVGVTQAIMDAYPDITPQRIVGHCDIAPGRKTDPGPAFDWISFKAKLVKDSVIVDKQKSKEIL